MSTVPLLARESRAAFAEELRVLPHVIGYEWRKASAFRMGLVLRELLRGIGRAFVMTLVYFAMFRGTSATTMGGYRLIDLIAYLVWTTVILKCITDEKSLDIGEQIFDGYITKYLVMPVSFHTLVVGKFVQFTAVQVVSAVLFWVLGSLVLPAYWPTPASALGLAQACVLVLLGAYCYLLVNFILNCLAFWLDVVWSLLNMFRFVSLFISGGLVPIALMPEAVQQTFAFTFPYWTVFAPAQLLLGRMSSVDFAYGLLALLAWTVALQALAWITWRRGIARYAGAGA